MSFEDKTITKNMNVTAVDIQTMSSMSDDEYREYLQSGLFFKDHHDVLRSEPAGYPIASTREQLDMLVRHLEALRSEIPPKRLR